MNPQPPAPSLCPPLDPPPARLAPRREVLAPTATPVGHLVCDPQGQVGWADEVATAMLAGAQVLLQADGRLGVRSHRLGLLALRSAMRLAALGAPPVQIALRHDRQALLVGVHALPAAADGTPRVLLSLRAQDDGQPAGRPQPDWKE